MKTRKLGKTDLELTTVGLGTWAIGGPWQFGWGPQDDEDAVEAIVAAVECGINWIDTAPVYGLGHSEVLVGQALKQMKQKPIIATKCGLRWNDNQEKVSNLEPESIKRECQESLERLDIDQIDLYQMHWPQPNSKIEEAWEAMAEMVEKGYVKYIGVSNFSVEQIERVKTIHPVVSLQPPYSMIKRNIEKELLGYCGRNDIGVVIYSPMQRGLLTGKYDKEKVQQLPDDDHRKRSPEFKDPMLSATLELLDDVRPIAEKYGLTLAQFAVAWTLIRPEVTSAIVGARRPDQIEETSKAAGVEFNNEDVNRIKELLREWQSKV